VFTIDRNGRSRSTGLDVHDQTESVFTIDRNAQRAAEFGPPASHADALGAV